MVAYWIKHLTEVMASFNIFLKYTTITTFFLMIAIIIVGRDNFAQSPYFLGWSKTAQFEKNQDDENVLYGVDFIERLNHSFKGVCFTISYFCHVVCIRLCIVKHVITINVPCFHFLSGYVPSIG